MADLTSKQIKRLTKLCDKYQDEGEFKMNDNEGLQAIAGVTRIKMDRDDYKDQAVLAQHSKFAVHCTVAVAALLMAGSGIGLTWCIAVFPAHPAVTVMLITTALFSLWLFTAVEDRL
ncbi:hypothetical protein [Rhodopila sp.]|uniref:hypothetical protein n=1 Tax=Rhodopila sp. TaxID=2480087 RepID=UPI003D0A61FA